MTLGEKLKKARKDAGMTRADLSRLAGISANTIANYENAGAEPSFFNICCLSRALHLSLDYLAGFDGGNDNDK